MGVINYDDIKFNSTSKNKTTNNNVLEYNSLFNIKEKELPKIPKKKKNNNILDTVKDTVGMGITKLAKGIGNPIEGLGDLGAQILKKGTETVFNPLQTAEKVILKKKTPNPLSTIVDKKISTAIFGKEAANDWKNTDAYQLGEKMEKDKVVETVAKPLENKFEENSIIKKDSLASNVLEGVGQVAGMAINPLGFKNTALKLGSKSLPIASGTKTMFMSTLGNSYTKAKQDGADDTEAMLYGLLSAGKETATEAMYGGLGKAFGKGALDDVVKNKISSMVKNKVGKKAVELGVSMTAEGLEEVASSLVEPLIQKVYKNKNEVDPITFSGILNDFVSGALVSGVIQGADGVINRKRISNSNTDNSKISTQNINNALNSKMAENGLNQVQNNTNNYKYVKSDNIKIDNLRKSASSYFNDSIETKNLINTYEKIIADKDYNVIFDNTLTNDSGNIVDAKINTLDNGETEIRINPNSNRAGEFLIMHEVTHAIETDEIKNLVIDYASKNSEFNDALESLKQTYGTSDVSSEVLADISGQLFGNQEFINELSMQKPNVFRRIYNKIIELANKITGNSKESLFLKDLKNKWENAYRIQNNILKDSKYSIGGISAIQNLDNSNYKQDALNNYQKAQQMKQQGYSNEEIRQNTKWFQDKYGKWKFEFSDELIRVKNTPNKNTTYKLDDIIEHPYLFKLYPQLKNYNIKFEEMKSNASHFFNEKTIKINNRLIENTKSMSGTLLHEIQHAIQHYEGFKSGTTSSLGKIKYANNLGEIEAADTKKRYLQNLNTNDRKLIAPESSKKNPIHPQRKQILSTANKVEKGIERVYNVLRGGSDEIAQKNNLDNSSSNNISNKYADRITSKDNNILLWRNRSSNRGRGLNNSSFSLTSNEDNRWQEHLESNYKSLGTRTDMSNIKSNSSNVNINSTKEIPKDPTKEESYDHVDNYNAETKIIKDMLSKYTSLERSELISEKTYDSINGELKKLGKNLDDKTIDNLTNKIFKNLIDGKDIKNITNIVYNSINNPRKAKINEYRKLASNMIDNIVDWNDKKIGFSYQTETMKRNLYDIIPDKKKAKQVYETYFQTISENEATAKKFINEYNEKIKKLNLNNKESVAVQMYGEYKYNPETTLTGLQVDEYIEKNNLNVEKIKNSVEIFRSIYDELINKVNNVFIEQGYKPIEYRKGYFPHFVTEKPTSVIGKVAEKLGWKIKKENLPTDVAGRSDMFKPGKIWTSFSQQRTGDSTDYNALKGFDTYIRGAADYIYHTEDIQKLRALENEIRYQYSSDTIKKEVDEINNDNDLDTLKKQEEIDKIYERFSNQMPNFVTEIRRYTDGLANKKAIDDRNMEHKLNREIYSVMTNIQNRVNANMVGLNVSSALTNFIPITQGYSQISTKNMLKAIKDTIRNQVNNDGFENSSTFLTNRLKNPDNLYKTGLDKFNDKASFLFEGIDSITSNILVRGKYYDNVNKGMSETDALKDADEFAKDVMAGRSKGEMPTIYNEKNPFTKLYTSFQLEVKNQYGYMFKDIPRDLEDKGMKTLISAFMKMYLGAWLYNKFAESLTGRKSAFSPMDIIEETISTATNKNLSTWDKLKNTTTNALQEVPYVGGILGGGRLPINSAIPNVKIFEYFVNSFNEDKDKKKTAVNNLTKELTKPFMYIVMPVGGGQIKKTIEGLSMYSKDKKVKGSYTASGDLRFPVKEDILSKTQAVLFGQYSSKEAREYFDRGEKPLNEKQIQDYKNLNVPITKYWKYRSDLREINKITADKDEKGKSINGSASGKKAYEIMNNKLYSKKEKNYLLSQLSSSDKDETIESLKLLDNDQDVYKYYFGLNTKARKNFVNAINEYDFSAKELYDFNISIDKSDSTQKKISVTNYLKNSDLNDKQIAYLYEKSGYSSEEKLDVLLNSNIPLKSFVDLQLRITDIKGDTDIKSNIVGKTISGSKKKKILKEVNETKGLSKEQKLLTIYLLGYSVSTGDFSGYTTNSSRKIVFDYVNKLKLSKSLKSDILEQAGYTIYKNGRIGW